MSGSAIERQRAQHIVGFLVGDGSGCWNVAEVLETLMTQSPLSLARRVSLTIRIAALFRIEVLSFAIALSARAQAEDSGAIDARLQGLLENLLPVQ